MVLFHAADLHLDSPLRGLGDYPATASMRGATRRAFTAIVDRCRAERAVALLLAGDIFDSDTRDMHAGLFFMAELSRLADVGTQVYVVRGNHDSAANAVSAELAPPPHVHIYPHDRAATVVDHAHGIAVHGMSYPNRAAPDSLLPHYPPPVPGLLNIGLLHTNAVASPSHAPYAPTTIDALLAHGYQYWALGHVHEHRIHPAAGRWVVYPGNSQGRTIRETGPRGCVRIEVDASSRTIQAVTRVIVDVARWERVVVDVGEATSVADVHHRVAEALRIETDRAEGRPLACRLTLTGTGPGHGHVRKNPPLLHGQLRADAAARTPPVCFERIQIETRAPSGVPAEHGLRAELERAAATYADDPAGLVVLMADEISGLERAMKWAGPQGDEPQSDDHPRLEDPLWLRARLDGARAAALRALLEDPS